MRVSVSVSRLIPPLLSVTRVTKQLMLLEEGKKRLEEELERSREEARANAQELQAARARLRDAVSREEHCSVTQQLRRWRILP